MNWREFFPSDIHPNIRSEQVQILDFVTDCIEKGKRDILIEAPTGVGKSDIAFTLTRMLRGCIATTTIALEDQYMRDFGSCGLRQLHSKANYGCLRIPLHNCEVGHLKECPLLLSNKEIANNPRRIQCPYQQARWQFDVSSSKIANISFMINYTKSQRWRMHQVAIFAIPDGQDASWPV